MLEVKLKHMLEAQRYSGEPKNILTFHVKTEIIIILCLLNA